MTRINVEIDEELVERAMRRYRLPSRRVAVELALLRLVGAMTRDEALAMKARVGTATRMHSVRRMMSPTCDPR